MSLRTWWKRNVQGVKEVEIRTRDDQARYVADDPATREAEAWTTKDVPIEKTKQ